MAVKTQARPRARDPMDLRIVAESVPALSMYERSRERGRVLALLREHVGPNTALDDALVDAKPGDELVALSLSYDKLAIRHWIELLAAAEVAETARLQSLLYGLDALVRVHKWKENELLLAMLESRSRRLSLVG